MEATRVLLVDDELEFAEALERQLESRDYFVTVVQNGDEALEAMAENDFEVVVLDLSMPSKDSLETLYAIKQRKPLTEVIMLSGKGTEEAAIEGMKRGAFDFLAKPPDTNDLVGKIHEAHAKIVEHMARIQVALEAEKDPEAADPEQGAESEEPPPADPASVRGRLVVVGQDRHFSDSLIIYALNMAERLSYEIVAANTAGFSMETFNAFPRARERACLEFRMLSERNVGRFREAAARSNVPFSHVVKYSGLDEATQEIGEDLGKVDFVVFEPTDELVRAEAGTDILVYSPA